MQAQSYVPRSSYYQDMGVNVHSSIFRKLSYQTLLLDIINYLSEISRIGSSSFNLSNHHAQKPEIAMQQDLLE